MPKSQYICLILFLIVVVTFINLYYKPYLTDSNKTLHWFQSIIDPVSKSTCSIQGFKCPSDELCDCEKFCANGSEFTPFTILDESERIYMLQRKLSPGTYCLPKGVHKCNLKTSYHVFSLAGWSCISVNDDIFKRNKKKACQNEEAQDNSLNILYDHLTQKEAGDHVENYYEHLPSKSLRYSCQCNSKSLDNTRMVSIFPFICSTDFCLRDIPYPTVHMGWDGKRCECGPYFHLNPNDKTSPCRKDMSRIENNVFTGRVDCMNRQSFIKQTLICPTDDVNLVFRESILIGDEPERLMDILVK